MPPHDQSRARPNILLILSDEERQRRWIPKGLTMPHRQRLIDEGLEFTRFYAHSIPCSPSRASLITGRYLPQHGVTDNVGYPWQQELDPSIPTLGHLLRRAGYYTAYIGKWHLSHGDRPNMESYGFSDWSGNDRLFRGKAQTGLYFDPIIARQAVAWLRAHTASGPKPWFLIVSLVNPHDVMWFPADQPWYQAALQKSSPERLEQYRQVTKKFAAECKAEFGKELPMAFPYEYDEVFDTLPPNFDDDLFTKPPVQRQWLWSQQHLLLQGDVERHDRRTWLRMLDYSWHLHQENDRHLGAVLQALEASGHWDDTIVIFTSDHGDMCGSHGLRSKGPFVYEEITRIPLYVRGPG
ncbi:MAG: sulfatase-like hydrolase/transferase, partial [Chloroflexi bacterium]|nr:sulfatase-like hydrolase/transferase [Chloroflexota bacterium]